MAGDQRGNCWLGFKTSAQLHLKTEESAQSVLVVRFFLARAGDAVLGLAGARAQAVQSPTILGVINVVLEEKLNRRKDFFSASRNQSGNESELREADLRIH